MILGSSAPARVTVALAIAGLLVIGPFAAGSFLSGDGALAQVVAAQPGVGGAQGVGGQINITVIAEERDLRSVIREIERKAGVNIYVDSGIEEVVSVRLINLPWRQVLEVVARDAGVEIERRAERLYVLTQPPRVFMEFSDADIRAVLDLLARQAGKNIVIGDEVRGNVTLNLRNVHWWRALNTIVLTAGYVAVEEEGGDIVRITRRENLQDQLETKVYTLKYIRPPSDYKAIIQTRTEAGSVEGGPGDLFIANKKAPEGIEGFTLLKALKEMVDEGEKVDYNEETNSFIVKATATKHAEIRDLLEKIDRQPDQVFVDVKFVTTSNSNFWRAGMKMGDPSKKDKIDQAGFLAGLGMNSAQATDKTEPGVPGDAGNFMGQFPFVFGNAHEFLSGFHVPAVLNFSQMAIVAQFVEVDHASKVTQSPTLLSLSDKPAVIFVGEKVPFAEQKAQADPNGNVTVTITEAAKSPEDVGFTLFITPHVVRDTDQIIMTVIPRITSLTGTGPGGLEEFVFADQFGNQTFIRLPRVSDQSLVTNLLVRDGQTAVIGGLMQETVIEVEERIPVLSAIPLLGNLFTYESKDFVQENQIMFITPRVVQSGSQSSELFKRQYQIFQENDFFYTKYLKEADGAARARPKGKREPKEPSKSAKQGKASGARAGSGYGEPRQIEPARPLGPSSGAPMRGQPTQAPPGRKPTTGAPVAPPPPPSAPSPGGPPPSAPKAPAPG
ncbi:type II secretion system protein GspD [Planctomycetota bacterium]